MSRAKSVNSADVKQEIANWDGKAVDVLEVVYDRHCQDAGFGAELVRLLKPPVSQAGASWLLKRYLELGNVLKVAEVRAVFETLSHLEDWQAKLHLLQCLAYLTIGKRDIKRVEPFLRVCLDENNKFVRAWAYNGFYELALQYPDYQAEVNQLLDRGMQDEAASVKARIRNIRKDIR